LETKKQQIEFRGTAILTGGVGRGGPASGASEADHKLLFRRRGICTEGKTSFSTKKEVSETGNKNLIWLLVD
jgi:hypothetical protein